VRPSSPAPAPHSLSRPRAERLRLLLLTPDSATTDRASAIAQWLARRDHVVSAVGATGRGRQRKLLPAASGALARGIAHVSFAVASAPALLAEAATFRPDLVGVLVASAAAASAALAAARLAGVPAWLHLEEDAPPLGLEGAFALVSATSFDAEERLQARGVSAPSALALPPWAELGDGNGAAVRESMGVGEDDVVALYTGWCGDARLAHMLIDAARQVPPKGAIRFVAACDGPAARHFVPGPRLSLVKMPVAEALRDLLAAADMHLLPQGPAALDPLMPAKLPTLLASGRPVLAGPPPGPFTLPLDVTSGERIADAVVALAAAAEERRARGLAARRAAGDYFAKERVLRALERRLLGLAGR
jgi:colanic acid biosynthesis glycosyl transferase WcaI